MKVRFFIVQTRHNTLQIVQDSVHNKPTENIDVSIRLRIFAQRFTVFSAKRLQKHNVYQFISLEDVGQTTRCNRINSEHSKHDVRPHSRTTMEGKAITRCIVCSIARYTKMYQRATLHPAFSHSFSFTRLELDGATTQSGGGGQQQRMGTIGKRNHSPSTKQTRNPSSGLQ